MPRLMPRCRRIPCKRLLSRARGYFFLRAPVPRRPPMRMTCVMVVLGLLFAALLRTNRPVIAERTAVLVPRRAMSLSSRRWLRLVKPLTSLRGARCFSGDWREAGERPFGPLNVLGAGHVVAVDLGDLGVGVPEQ